MSNKGRSIALVAGKSGGHIIPALSYAHTHYPHQPIIFFATTSPIDGRILAHSKLHACYFLRLMNFPRTTWWQYPLFAGQFITAFIRSFFALMRHRPSRVISMGGYISIPVVLAAWCARIPVELFELNADPGRALKVLAPYAKKIMVCFTEAQAFFPPAQVHYTAYPLRFSAHDRLDRQQARQLLGLASEKILLILGGSQGSRFINDSMADFIAHHKDCARRMTIMHQTGDADCQPMKTLYNTFGVHAEVFSFKESMALYYSAADVVLCRAGAGTLFEVVFFDKPALVIPLETQTTHHQVANAYALQRAYPQLITVIRQQALHEDHRLFASWLMKIVMQLR